VDRRQMKNEKINGWIDDTETVSPIDDLFSLLVPMLMMEGTPSLPLSTLVTL
jgi:hypothetical protein